MTVQDNTHLGRLPLERGAGAIESAGYQVQVTSKTEDMTWDNFLTNTPGGHHVQTSFWAQLKAMLGWRAVRIVVTQGDRIVAGAQMLMRPLPLIGALGYVPKGPVFASEDPRLPNLVVSELQRVAKVNRILYLVVQPPDNGKRLARQLSQWNFGPSPVKISPTATVLIDLSQDLEAILAQMKSKTRYNIRLGQRKGITVREGTERDLPTFYRLLLATGQRQDFGSNSEDYFSRMWRSLSPHSYCKLFLAEFRDEAVSGLLAVSFGDTVIYKRGAWSGRHGDLRPNEVLHWTALSWAKSQGYRYYDFDGIDPVAARALTQGESLPKTATQTVTRFKLGFGGQVTLLPDTYGHIYNRFLRGTYNTVYPKIGQWSVIQKAITRFRTR